LSEIYFNETLDKILRSKNKLKGSSICFVSENIFVSQIFLKDLLKNIPNLNELDILYIKPENGNIKIDKIREIDDFILYRPNYSEERIIVIEEIDKLTQEAANAALKIIEEPPYYSIIFATTTRWNYLLPTIKSRFIRFDIPLASSLVEEVKDKYDNLFFTIDFFKYRDIDVLFYLNSEQNNVEETKKQISKIFSFDENNIDEILKNMKLPITSPENKIKVSFTYFKMWDIIIRLSEKDFFFFLKKLSTIKSDIETLSFLKYISYLGTVLIRDLLISQLSSKWKFFWNKSLVYFFGFNNCEANFEESINTLKYLNNIMNAKVSNFNFEMEIINHFLRIRKCFIR
jgi:DNA polymerase-3 subunit delta'/DNA polymerase-3 subunit gamma/tau